MKKFLTPFWEDYYVQLIKYWEEQNLFQKFSFYDLFDPKWLETTGLNFNDENSPKNSTVTFRERPLTGSDPTFRQFLVVCSSPSGVLQLISLKEKSSS